MPKITEKFVKIARTCVLYLSYFALGLGSSVPGPTLLDLQYAVRTDTKHIAFIYSSRSTGYLLGSLLGGIFFDLVKSKQILLIVCNFFMSLFAVAIPWSPNLGVLIVTMAGGGLAMGALDTGSNVWLLNIWGKESPPFLQALHFAFGFGGFIGPLIAAPFLSEHARTASDNSSELILNGNFSSVFSPIMNFSTSTLITDDLSKELMDSGNETKHLNETETGDIDSTSLKYIYSIVGGFSFLVTFLFMLLYLLTTKEETSSGEKKDENLSTPGRGFTYIVSFLTGIVILVYAGIEIGYAQMLVTYVVKGNLKLSKSTGSFMTSVFWGTFTFSRALGILLSLYVNCLTLMVGDLVLTLISGGILLLLGTTSETFLWIGTALLGVALASFFPAAISWVERYIVITNKVASVFTVGAAIGEMVIPLLISQFIESFPEVLFYAVESSGLLCTVTLLVLWLIAKRKGERYPKDKKKGEDNNAVEEDRL